MEYPPILVVEDSPEDFDTVVEAARRLKLKNAVVRATDAFEAARLLGLEEKEQTDPPFCLMLLDYNLPGKNGGDFLREYSNTLHGWRTPVIVFTSSTSLQDCKECYSAGASAYHAKPVKYQDCLRTIEGIFSYWLEMVMLPKAGLAVKQ